jgi:hypothetical protein
MSTWSPGSSRADSTAEQPCTAPWLTISRSGGQRTWLTRSSLALIASRSPSVPALWV